MSTFITNELKLVLGTVVMSSPQWGFMIVADETQTINRGAKTFVAYMGTSPSGYGAGIKYAYPPGTPVICALNPSSPSTGFVICPVNNVTKDMTVGNRQWRGYLSSTKSGTDKCQWAALDRLVGPGMRNIVSNRSIATDPNQYPGDYVISDNSGTVGITISRLLMQLKASPLTYIELSSVTNKLTTLSDSVELNTPLTEVFQENGLYGHNTALSLEESLGTAVGSGTGSSSSASAGGAPYFRFQFLEGAAALGRESLVTGKESGTPVVLSKRRDDISGELSDASAFGVMSIKSLDIHGMLQTSEDSGALRASYTPKTSVQSTAPSGAGGGGGGSGDSLMRDVSLNRFNRGNAGHLGDSGNIGKVNDSEAVYSNSGSGNLMAAGGVKGSETTVFSTSAGGADKAPYGFVTGESYALPKAITLTDPVSGISRNYYATESCISQEPNGDILLSDGYGSEIRMSRGNIYISPALDCIIRPGRDASVMAGRYQSYNSQDTCTMSTKGDLYVKSGKDLKIAGALSQKRKVNQYAVTLESGSDAGSTGGVVIRSNSGVTLTSNNIYIGRNTNKGTSKNSVTYPEQPGSIIIDAGRDNGSFAINAKENLIFGKANTILSEAGGNAGALVGTGGSWMLTGGFLECAMNMGIGTLKASNEPYEVKVPKAFKTEGSVTIDTRPSSGKYIICLEGELYTTGNIMANGWGLFKTGAYAKQMASTNPLGHLGYIRRSDKEIWDPWKFPTLQAIDGAGSYVTALVNQMSLTIYNDAFISEKGFYFPTYKVSIQTIPGMRWQYMDQESQNQAGEQTMWKEEYIPKPGDEGTLTACYPGYDTWQQATISAPGGLENPLESSYVINAPDSDAGGA